MSINNVYQLFVEGFPFESVGFSGSATLISWFVE
jgi:hypothetical protein